MTMLENLVKELFTNAVENSIKRGDFKRYREELKVNKYLRIVNGHSAAAGAAAFAAGILPGAGSLVSAGIAVGAIWSMYVRLANYMRISWSKDLLKVVASAVLSNIVTQLGGLLVLGVVGAFVPGLSLVACGLVNFIVVYIAGIIFTYVLNEIFKAGVDLDELDAEQLKQQFAEAADSVDMKAAYKEGKETFNQMRKDGTLEDMGSEYDIKQD